MNFNECLDYLKSLDSVFCKPGLSRTKELCQRLGSPEKSLKFIHVTGTNGKGSFCAMLSAILAAQGYKTGTFSSPAILSITEQLQINGKSIEQDVFATLVTRARTEADKMDDRPTSFELLTALSFLYFKNEDCDLVVLEVGMGGRLDATNVIPAPLLAVITGINIDHSAFLGSTMTSIAKEKSGIIKRGSSVLFGGENGEALDVIKGIAKETDAPLYRTEQEKIKNTLFSLSGTTFDYKDRKGLRLPLLGSYQPKNAANVLEAVEILNSSGIPISDNAIRSGLASTVWRARFEKISSDPLIIFDGAHNPDGIKAATESIRLYFADKKVYILSGVLRDKDYSEIAKMLSEVALRAFTVCPPSARALNEKDYARVLSNAGIPSESFADIKEAFLYAKSEAKKNNVPLVCLGSLYNYAALYTCF
jgi:dihydrofolate synthase/folylpolyglutamate synthase